MAISEYAPGRIIVINKDVYKSGGIYSFHSKFKPGEQEHPARPYFQVLIITGHFISAKNSHVTGWDFHR